MAIFIQFVENIILLRNVALFQTPHVLDGITPFLLVVRKFLELLSGGKFSQIYQKKGHFLRKNTIFVVLQHHMLYKIATSFQFWDFEIGKDDGDDRRVVVLSITFCERIADDAGRVGYHPVFQEFLTRLLHLHDNVLLAFVLAGTEDIKDNPFVLVGQPELLRRAVGDVGDRADIRRQKGVEEMDKVLLVRLGTEEALETEIGQQVDVFCFVTHKNCFWGVIT